MKYSFFSILLTLLFGITSCVSERKESRKTSTLLEQSNSETIPYTLIKNYFVKNNATPLNNPRIETSEEFNAFFGSAATMGKEGKPTELDFKKKHVIAVVLPETERSITLTPLFLKRVSSEKLVFYYKKETGELQSYKIIPFLAISVNLHEKGNITVVELQ
jgi:hypothetical protein